MVKQRDNAHKKLEEVVDYISPYYGIGDMLLTETIRETK